MYKPYEDQGKAAIPGVEFIKNWLKLNISVKENFILSIKVLQELHAG